MTSEPDMKIVEDTTPTVTKELKKPELIDRVVAVSGLKKKDVKPVVEATLAVLGQSLSDGEQLNLQPFGKTRTVKQKTLPNGQAMTVKLRRSAPSLEETEELPGTEQSPDAPSA
ncbi:HU family DNA-binding protein [Palleronia sp.]|uniref:HU family DNA-binding protein n=1 Tax=Palleronia sp. TaxID=1940284 RepID=UPI0035C7D8D4